MLQRKPTRYLDDDGEVWVTPPTTEHIPNREPERYVPSPDFVIALVIGILAGFALAILVA